MPHLKRGFEKKKKKKAQPEDVCYDDRRGASTSFSLSEVPQFGSLRPLPKTDLEKNKKNAHE